MTRLNSSFAVILDMDGVIVDSNPVHKIALKQFFRKYGFDFSEAELKEQIYGHTNRDWITMLFGRDISEGQFLRYEEEKESLYRRLFEADIRPVRGLPEFLEDIRQNRVPCAIATSAPPTNVSYVLDKTNLGGYFTLILDETDISRGKPDPEIYLKTAAALKIKPNRCVVFEDSIAGIRAALGAGCRVIGVTTTHPSQELTGTDMNIASFEDISYSHLLNMFR